MYSRDKKVAKHEGQHTTVLCLVTWPLIDSKAGGDLALIQTSQLLSCKCTYCS